MQGEREHLSDELLHRHFDGDLESGEAARADAHLHACPQCAAKRAGLAKLSELVAMDPRASAQEVSFAGMFDRIERGIAAEKLESSRPRVLPITSRKRSFAASSALIAGFAAAAAVILMVYHPGEGGSHGNSVPDGQVPGGPSAPAQTAPATAPAPVAAKAPSHSEVVQVDFGSNAGTVFDISLADGSSTPVIWINDDE
jgi:anti-sigma factor RsiW